MPRTDNRSRSTGHMATVWLGRILTAFVAFAFGVSGIMKLVGGGPEMAEGLAHLGLRESVVVPLAILELTCLAIYLVPATSVLGAILLTGYMGGAICTHWRVGDPFIIQALLGVVVWLSVYCREPRLRRLIPLRKSSTDHQ